MNLMIDQYIDQINKYAHNFEKNKNNKNFLLLLDEIKQLHAADIADILENSNDIILVQLFFYLSPEKQADVFMEFSHKKRQFIFLDSSNNQREILLDYLTIDELVDFFDDLSDEDVNSYIQLLNKKERKKVLSLLEFPETSAAGIMESDIVVLSPNINVSKTIFILKRLKANKTLYRTIYIVDERQILLGYILLEDLVLEDSENNINSFMDPILYCVNANDDQEEVATYMTHYRLDIVPVIDLENHFLGVITAEIVARKIEDEASEDILKMASLSPIQDSYFQTNILKLIWQRSSILTILLLMQSLSTIIIGKYTLLLSGFLITYIGMITSTGGNTSSQVSALVIQGLASGDIKTKDMIKFIKRELIIGSFLGTILSIIGAIRTYFFHYQIQETIIVGCALFCIVIFSTLLGSFIPFLLHKIKLDPAYSAGPLLATCMDILGVIIFTLVIFFIQSIFLL
jgi:magnesium transporter